MVRLNHCRLNDHRPPTPPPPPPPNRGSQKQQWRAKIRIFVCDNIFKNPLGIMHFLRPFKTGPERLLMKSPTTVTIFFHLLHLLLLLPYAIFFPLLCHGILIDRTRSCKNTDHKKVIVTGYSLPFPHSTAHNTIYI